MSKTPPEHVLDALIEAGATGKTMAPARVASRRWAAGVLRGTLDALVAAGHKGATGRAVARRLGISHARVQRLCGDGDPAVTLGDIRAMGNKIARAVLSAALADCAPAPKGSSTCPQAITLVALSHVGDLADIVRRVVADGRVTKGEWVEVDAKLAELEAWVCQARATVRVAMRGGR